MQVGFGFLTFSIKFLANSSYNKLVAITLSEERFVGNCTPVVMQNWSANSRPKQKALHATDINL